MWDNMSWKLKNGLLEHSGWVMVVYGCLCQESNKIWVLNDVLSIKVCRVGAGHIDPWQRPNLGRVIASQSLQPSCVLPCPRSPP
ncbi:hypothetical protein J6590_031231 [Homalodisca vitripennis]|nr:hypothetical protein J6590_031231 [Homalodisca vitripennis]